MRQDIYRGAGDLLKNVILGFIVVASPMETNVVAVLKGAPGTVHRACSK